MLAYAVDEMTNSKKQLARSGKESLVELVVIVITAIGLALLIQAFLVKPFKIPSISMAPTLEVGQRILVNRIDGRFGNPERGDVTVFYPPSGAPELCGVQAGEKFNGNKVFVSDGPDSPGKKMPCAVPTPGKLGEAYVKRVVGMPGERIKIIRGHVYINGKQLSEPYINSQDSCDDDATFSERCTAELEITIPSDHYFMMGDNRNNSQDSRYWGPLPKQNVVGEAFATYWPLDRAGTL